MDVSLPSSTPKTVRQSQKSSQPQAHHLAFTSTAAWLTLQSLPLLLTPSLIASLTVPEPRRISDLETYLCRTLGLTLLALATMILFLTGTFPLVDSSSTTTTSSKDATSETTDASVASSSRNVFATPTLLVTTVYHATSAFYLYTHVARGGTFGLASGMIGSTALFGLGVWCLLFGGGKGRRSKSTGADKRTSGYPFRNEESAREKKKESKRKSVLRTKSRAE